MRNGCMPLFFEIKVPNVPINESDDQCSAEQNCCCANMIAPWCINSVSGNRGVEGEDQTEKAKEQAELNTGATLQESPNSKGDKKRPDKYHYGDRVSLRFGSRVEHQGDSILEPDRRNSF